MSVTGLPPSMASQTCCNSRSARGGSIPNFQAALLAARAPLAFGQRRPPFPFASVFRKNVRRESAPCIHPMARGGHALSISNLRTF
jgi:hypothetical protein